MIKFEHTEVVGWEAAIRGMRNPLESWEKSDSGVCCTHGPDHCIDCPHRNTCRYEDSDINTKCIIGPNDLDLMKRLIKAGTDHRKFMRMIIVYVDITAPLYWWKEFDTYKVGTVANSCSTMHKIHAKEFEWIDFSIEKLTNFGMWKEQFTDADASYAPAKVMRCVISALNGMRDRYLDFKSRGPEWRKQAKQAWHQMIQLLPNSYNQKRTVMMSYEVLANIYKSRKNHKLDEWCEHKLPEPVKIDVTRFKDDEPKFINAPMCTTDLYFGFCDWIKALPYSKLITGDFIKED